VTAPFPRLRKPRRVLTAGQYAWLALGTFIFSIYGNLIPFRYQPRPWDEALAVFRQIPLYDPSDLGARGDWVVSVVVFAALSYLLMGALCVDRRRHLGLFVAPVVVAFCAALSVAIEFVQIFFPPRTVSLNDIVVENLGGLAGTVLWLAAGQRITGWVGRLEASTTVAGLARRLFPGYLALLLIVQLMPFDFTVSTAELAAKYHENKIWLIPFAYLPLGGKMEVLANMAGFFPLGFLWVLATQERQGSRAEPQWRPGLSFLAPPRPAPRAPFLFGLVVTSAVKLLQLCVYSRLFDTTDILTGTAAVWLGGQAALAWRRHQARSRSGFVPAAPRGALTLPVAALLFVTWLAGVLYINWKPFDFTADPARFTSESEDLPTHGLRAMSLLPLVDYYWGSKYQALDQFVRKTVSFLPLGILAALVLPHLFAPGAAWRVFGAALLLAAVVETGRYFLPSRGPSVTDLFIQCFGACLGFLLTRHVRVILWGESVLHV
jgi:VanZ family protein